MSEAEFPTGGVEFDGRPVSRHGDTPEAAAPAAAPPAAPAAAPPAAQPGASSGDLALMTSDEPAEQRAHGVHRLMLSPRSGAGTGGETGEGTTGRGAAATRTSGRRARPRRNRHRPVPLDWAALVLAVVLPPIGLLVAITAILVSRHRVGWSSGVARVATSVAVALSLVLAAGAVVVNDRAKDAAAFDAIVERSAPFCAALASSPGTLQSDTFGWPAPANTIPASLDAMKQYEALWVTIAAAAPDGVKTGANDVLARAQSIIASVELSRTVNNDSNVALMRATASRSGVVQWSGAYCKG